MWFSEVVRFWVECIYNDYVIVNPAFKLLDRTNMSVTVSVVYRVT